MKDFFYDLLIEPFTDNDWLSFFLGILMWVLFLFLFGILFFMAVWLTDNAFMPVKEKEGVVINKYIVPAHTTTTYMMNGKTMLPVITHHKTAYKLEITIDNLKDVIAVDQSYYEGVMAGQKVHCEYVNGRVSKTLYIKKVQ